MSHWMGTTTPPPPHPLFYSPPTALKWWQIVHKQHKPPHDKRCDLPPKARKWPLRPFYSVYRAVLSLSFLRMDALLWGTLWEGWKMRIPNTEQEQMPGPAPNCSWQAQDSFVTFTAVVKRPKGQMSSEGRDPKTESTAGGYQTYSPPGNITV